MTDPQDPTPQSSEILISGLDTGPAPEERDRPTRSERLARLHPPHPDREPEDEDG
ncbi:hypothetical protein [Deinococcus wulumuqiensis]|uniref:Uncharacterized protein n=1 Tax=Deinococcus wulumuqiensis TaxID=980427 RepID=A0A345IHQ6_9DEIO|nr:hypothetical protein [Deinococcus wulumuqiensis]AXG99228.1 hypothetical protein DVJ83_08780 [Deinococcus wulumuqiensis]QII21654.1 hypothetical protein G6R31_13735 [Deinococcus wulumuqiensis R12]GGI91010.1 hypothetical protein GCM10010914_26710 [Deinococcus wulumuqiensis]GGP30912.1 hypothetical protein GCM10008021_25630 [Deinococcus wulumuqiensis]